MGNQSGQAKVNRNSASSGTGTVTMAHYLGRTGVCVSGNESGQSLMN